MRCTLRIGGLCGILRPKLPNYICMNRWVTYLAIIISIVALIISVVVLVQGPAEPSGAQGLSPNNEASEDAAPSDQPSDTSPTPAPTDQDTGSGTTISNDESPGASAPSDASTPTTQQPTTTAPRDTSGSGTVSSPASGDAAQSGTVVEEDETTESTATGRGVEVSEDQDARVQIITIEDTDDGLRKFYFKLSADDRNTAAITEILKNESSAKVIYEVRGASAGFTLTYNDEFADEQTQFFEFNQPFEFSIEEDGITVVRVTIDDRTDEGSAQVLLTRGINGAPTSIAVDKNVPLEMDATTGAITVRYVDFDPIDLTSLPVEAYATSLSSENVSSIARIRVTIAEPTSLDSYQQRLVLKVRAEAARRLFYFIRVDTEKTLTLHPTTGEVLEVEQPWWTRVFGFLAPEVTR